MHISDVAAFIAPKSKFDKQAEKRSFSCYLPGRTLPMLPKALTAKISLQAGVNSNAHSVFLTVEKETGRVVSFRRCHTVVKVDHRLNYEEVQEFLDHGKAPADWSDGLKKELRLMLDVTRNMRKYRKAAEGFIELDLPEVRVLCSEADNKILGMVSKMPRESEQLVEECMLAANSAVGTELGEKGIAGIYRVHPQPDPEKIAEFTGIMEDSFGLTPGDLTERKACNAFLAGLPDDPRRPVILSLMLRSMPRAYYLEKPALHFGLGKTRYAHFTSPIRRYPDLIVHQQLWNYDTKTRTRTAATMTRVAADCSMKEENNDAAYFAANDRLKLRYLEERLDAGLDNFYEGVIVKVVAERNSGRYPRTRHVRLRRTRTAAGGIPPQRIRLPAGARAQELQAGRFHLSAAVAYRFRARHRAFRAGRTREVADEPRIFDEAYRNHDRDFAGGRRADLPAAAAEGGRPGAGRGRESGRHAGAARGRAGVPR